MNPYILLASVLAIGAASFSGYRFGVNHERGEAALRINEAAISSAEKAKKEAEIEATLALAEAKATAARRAAARDKQHQLEMEIARDETSRHCRVSDATISLLNSAIDSANGTETKADPIGVPEPTPTDRADGFRPGAMDRGFLRNIRRLPGVTQTADGVDQP